METIDRGAPQPRLARTVGLGLLTLYGLGNIVGAGIYVLVGEVAGASGMLAPLAFLVAAGVATLAALTYGELAARHPVSAGEAVYLHRAFGRADLATAVGLLIALAGLVSAATLARGFVGYAQVIVDVPAPATIAALVVALTALAAWGIGPAMGVAAALTVLEVGGLLLVVGAAAPDLPSFVAAFDPIAPADTTIARALAAGAFLAFFAFIGFEDMVNVAEEVERPARNVPLAIVLALAISTVLYVMVLAAALAVLGPARLAAADAPLAAVWVASTGLPAWPLGALGAVAVINGALVQTIMAARVLYGLAASGWCPPALATIHPVTRTPLLATACAGAGVLMLALAVPLGRLAAATSALVLVVFALVSAALIAIKRRAPSAAGVRALPAWVPVAALAAALALLLAQFA